MEEQEQMDVASIFRCIFCSCDVDNTDLVPVSKLIEFVQPFMIEDLNAVEELRSCLDPEGKNVLVNSERFYEVMGHWSQKLVGNSSPEHSEFNRTPGKLLEIDDKDLPYTHSTPRASLGDKLLRCRDLLNLSNVSGYSLSTSKFDKTNNVLEEEIKRLEHLLLKTTNELTITKQQLAASEEQNETNQQDLEKLNRRLHNEQQVNELLHKEKNINEDLRDELSQYKKLVDELKRKLAHAEKDSMYHKEFVNELDEEKDKLIKKVEFLTRQHQDCLKEIFDLKTDLESKDQQVNDIKKVYEELKFKFSEQKDFIDQLREQNEILSHQKATLEKVIKAKSSTSVHSNLGNLDFTSSNLSLSQHHTPNTGSPSFLSPNSSHQYTARPKCESKPLLRQVLGRHSSTPTWPTDSLLDRSVPYDLNNQPVLSPICLERVEGDQNQESSEEDLYFQLQQGREKLGEHDPNGITESLHTEMHRAEPDGISETYPTFLFEKDEKLMILEEELEGAKKYLKEVEDEKNELITKLKEQQKVNEGLIDSNFVLITKEESCQTKIKSLKKKLEQLEGNGIIVENEHEVTLGEIEELKTKIEKMNNEIKSKDIEIQELKSRADSIISHKKEINQLKKELECSKYQKILENKEDERNLVHKKNEQMMILEEELEGAKKYLKEVEDEKNELLTKLKEQQKVNEDLIETNFVLITKEESSQTKIKSLKQKLEQLEGNSILVEKEHKVTLDEIEELKAKIEKMNNEIKSKNIEIQELKSKADSIVSHEKEINQLKKELECSKNQKILGKEEDERNLVHEKMMILEEELEGAKKYLKEVEDEKNELLTKLKEQQKVNEDLIETNFVLITKEESCQTKMRSLKQKLEQLEGNSIIVEKEHKVTLGEIEELKTKIEKMNNEIKSKDIEIQELKSKADSIVSHEKEINQLKKELECSKNQERKDEKLELTINKLKEDLSHCLSKLSSKSRHLIDTQNRLKLLEEREIQLAKDNDLLKASYNIGLVSTEIQKHINSKNEVIEELKQLNLKMECNLNEAQTDIKQKIDEILKIRNEWTNSIGIRNDLWQIIRTLQEENQELLNSKEELKIEYSNLLICYDLEVIKNTKLEKERLQAIEEKNKFTKFMSESEAKLYELQSQLKLTKTDNMSQTTTTDCKIFEEEFSKIKVESDKLLEELESRLNEEVDKNKDLTKNLIEIRQHLDQSNKELLKMKEKVTENEQKMLDKLQQNSESNKMLAKELSRAKENLQAKDVDLTDLGDRLKEMEKKLKILNEENMDQKKSQMETESKNEELLNNINHLETLLNEKQLKLKEYEDSISQLVKELNLTKGEKEKLNFALGHNTLEYSRTKNDLENRLKEMEKKLKILNEENIDQKKNTMETESKNQVLLNDINHLETLLNEKQIQIKEYEDSMNQLVKELNLTKGEKEKLNVALSHATQSQMETESKYQIVLKNINHLETLLNQKEIKIKQSDNSFNLLVNELSLTKAEKDKLHVELSDVSLQLSKTKIEFKKIRDSLEHRLNEEENKNDDLNKHLIEIKNKLDEKTFEFDTLNKTRNKLEADVRNLDEIHKKLKEELLETKKGLDMSKNEKEMLNRRLAEEIAKNTVLSKKYSVLKKEVNQKCLQIETITLELNETKRKLAKTVSCDSSTTKDLGKPKSYLKQQIAIDKLKDKLDHLENQLKYEKNKNEELKAQLSVAESKIKREKTFEKLEEESIRTKKETDVLENGISIEKELEVTNIEAENKIKDLKRTRSLPSLNRTLTNGDSVDQTTKCEGKPVNKFTIASRPASPDSPSLDIDVNGLDCARKLSFYTKSPYISCDTILEIPSLDISGLPDDIIEELGLTEDSPRKKLNREETERSVTALTLRFVINNKDISERIEKQTEKYRHQYEELLNLIRDISHRLRDHVCIGTAEPIMPVFVILEDIKLQLKELVKTAGQVGVLIYEDRMKKCWNLVTNYMAMLRKENELLSNVSRETTPTQTGLVRRRNRGTHEKHDLHVPTPRRRRRFIPCLRLTTILIVILALALTVSLVIHINCRMTASENQYCPLDGVVTRINMGVPPM